MKTNPYKQVTEEAMEAFWDVIVKRYPQAKTGDLSPLTTVVFCTAAEDAVEEWIFANVPKRHR
jgi:hypothetical protein